jgi:hypothetical protein
MMEFWVRNLNGEFDTVVNHKGMSIKVGTYKTIEEANERISEDAKKYINQLISKKLGEISLLRGILEKIDGSGI